MAETPRGQGFGPVLQNRRFVALWIGQAISNFGDALARIALIILVTDRVPSPVVLGLLMVSQIIPMILFGPFIGVLVDRWDKKQIMIGADLLRAAGTAVLVFGPPLEVVFGIAVAVVTLSLFSMPARSATTVEIVGTQHYLSAVSLSQTTFHGMNLLGPAIGGAVIGFFGTAAAFGLNAATFVLSAAITLLVRFPPMPRAQERGSAAEYWASLRDGAGFLRQNQRLWFLVRFFGPAVFGLGLASLLFLNYLRIDLRLPPTQFGLVQSVQGLGMLVATLAIGQYGPRWPKGRMIFDGFLVTGLLTAAFVLGPGFLPLMALMGLLGLAMGFVQVPVSALFGTLTPVEKRGRVFATTTSIIGVGNLAGYAAAGVLATMLTSTAILGIAGGLMVLASLALRRDPIYRLLNAPDAGQAGGAVDTSTGAVGHGPPAGSTAGLMEPRGEDQRRIREDV